MSGWLAAVMAMLPPLAGALWSACRASTVRRFAAVQLASSVAIWTLVLMSFAFDQASEIDLPLTAALLAPAGALLLALFFERWV